MNILTEIYTDGSCMPNPGNGSYGYVKLFNGKMIETFCEYEENTTNNRMEYKAIIEGIKSCEVDSRIKLYTDSMLAVNTINNWMFNWEKKNWNKKKGIKNLDLVQELFYLKKTYYNLDVLWIKGHSTHYWNNYIDNIVNAEVLKKSNYKYIFNNDVNNIRCN